MTDNLNKPIVPEGGDEEKILQTESEPISLTTIEKKEQIIKILHSENPIEEVRTLGNNAKTNEEKLYVANIISRILALPSIKIYTGNNKKLEQLLSDKILEIDVSKIEDASFVLAELGEKDSHDIGDFKGIERAFDLYTQNPDKKLILMSTVTFEDIKKIKKDNDKLKFLLSQKNFRFLYLFDPQAFNDFQSETGFDFDKDIPDGLKPRPIKSFDPKLLEELFEDEQEDMLDIKITAREGEVAFQNIIENEIGRFLHSRSNRENMFNEKSLGYEEDLPKLFNLPEDRKSQDWLYFEDKLIAMLQLQHPDFKLLSRVNNLQWIVDIYKYTRTKMLPEGTRFEGVFVDWDGTLYDNDNQKFNQDVIDMINDHEKQGKKITIRTGGDLETKQKLLDESGLNYKIQSKTDYKGGTVDIAIDNDPQEFLLANSKIKAETYIKV